MWRRAFTSLTLRLRFYSSNPEIEIPTLYSFLQPSIFTLKKPIFPPPPPSPNSTRSPPQTPQSLDKGALESDIEISLAAQNTDQAWKSFKLLTSHSLFPPPHLSNSLISHLSSQKDLLNLKRAFASVIFLLEKNPPTLSLHSVETLLQSMNAANMPAPAFALVRAMFKNRFFPPFTLWGPVLIEVSKKNGSFAAFLQLFNDNCRIALDEGLDFMRPDLGACNAALEGCCCHLGSISDAERVLEMMSILGVRPDAVSFGFLAYLYAFKGLKNKVIELESLVTEFGFLSRRFLYNGLVSGYVKSGNFESVSNVILRALQEQADRDQILEEESYTTIVKGYLANGKIKELAKLIIGSQELETFESSSLGVENSIGFGIINACIDLGMLDKAHCILDEMNAQGASIGLGVYSSILKAYCKERRTAEAAQMVAEINNLGLPLDANNFDALIDASMSIQDFQSAFSLFREMREAKITDLKMSYLTIMTGLTENHRPELMAAFLDEVVNDPRIEIGTHDWNSIIHAFCKLGRMEDARRTFRRMVFLRFQPNEQTYLSLINGYVTAGSYFSVLILWTEVKKRISIDGGKGLKFEHSLVDAFLFALVKGGFFDAVMQVVEKAQEMKIFVDKWRYKQAFMETHKKLKIAKLRIRNFRKMEALIAFKNWAGLNA